jgi:cysteinyl-tRNA synthetase
MTELKIHNTLTRKKEVFEPEDPQDVRMYVCGPTVYDFAHIGNARPVIVFDVLYRLLSHIYGDDHVTYVRNITDVDDKINARALRDYPDLPLNEAISKVTQKTADQFHADIKALGCLEPDHEPRATQHIEGMAEMIQTLLDRDHAYIAKGEQGREVLFRVSSMEDYGQLSNRKLEDQQAGARVAVEAHKENAGDFVLWKESNASEPGWQGTFNGETIHGRPGWHIECSVMAKHHLGETFDIHGGGLDLIFPHHENEIAQSRCAHSSNTMARYWMHNGYLQVEGKKMSKSEGNFVTICDLLESEKFGNKKWSGEVLRLAMLMTHYREPINFNVTRLQEAESKLKKWAEFLKETVFEKYQLEQSSISAALAAAAKSSKKLNDFGVEFLKDDLNVGQLIAYLDGTLRDYRLHNKVDKGFSFDRALKFFLLVRLLGLFSNQGLIRMLSDEQEVNSEVLDAINRRLEAFKTKDFAEADRIRDELASQGIQLKDSKDSETGERITTWEIKR